MHTEQCMKYFAAAGKATEHHSSSDSHTGIFSIFLVKSHQCCSLFTTLLPLFVYQHFDMHPSCHIQMHKLNFGVNKEAV